MKPPSDKLRLIALLLVLLFGGFGVHRMYVGKVGSGAAQLLLTVVGVGLVLSPLILVVGIWVLVDLVQIIAGTFLDKEQHPVLAWTN